VLEFVPSVAGKCLIEVDEYVPLRFRTYERPLGVSYLHLGNQRTSLLELLIDAKSQILRGITITIFPALSPWPQIGERTVSRGLPKLDVSWGRPIASMRVWTLRWRCAMETSSSSGRRWTAVMHRRSRIALIF